MARVRLAKLQELWECLEPQERHFLPAATWMRAGRPHGDVRYEDAQLLDPIDEDDPGLLSFNVMGRGHYRCTSPIMGEGTRRQCLVSNDTDLDSPIMDKRHRRLHTSAGTMLRSTSGCELSLIARQHLFDVVLYPVSR